MTYKYDASLEFRTSFDTSVYDCLSASVRNFSPVEDDAIIDSSYVEQMIEENARSESSLERAIILKVLKKHILQTLCDMKNSSHSSLMLLKIEGLM